MEKWSYSMGNLLLSQYCSLSRRRMYWSVELDIRNELIVISMRRTRFGESIKYYTLLITTTCAWITNRFAKIRPLLNALCEKYLELGEAFRPRGLACPYRPGFGLSLPESASLPRANFNGVWRTLKEHYHRSSCFRLVRNHLLRSPFQLCFSPEPKIGLLLFWKFRLFNQKRFFQRVTWIYRDCCRGFLLGPNKWTNADGDEKTSLTNRLILVFFKFTQNKENVSG